MPSSTSSSSATLGDGQTLWERWSSNAAANAGARAIVHWRAGEEPIVWSWGELVARALQYATLLRAHGVSRGDVCALMLRHSPSLYPLYMGLTALGAVPSVLAYPNARLHPEKFAHGLRGMARRSGLAWLVTERELEERASEAAIGESSTVRGLLFPHEWDVAGAVPATPEPPPAPTDVCLLQHSSGTTGLQKAVSLSHGAVLGHVERYAEALDLSRDDCVVSWLPLYHDMGLIAAFHLPLAAGITTVQIDPLEWVTMPAVLLDALSRERGTLCWMPNFAFHFMAERVHDDELEHVDLRSLRAAVNCSEPVRPESVAKFLSRFAPVGLRDTALTTCYAMAETTFAVTQSAAGRPVPVVRVDRRGLSEGVARDVGPGALGRDCMSSGAPIRGCSLRVVDEGGADLADDRVGEIWIRSESMFTGYRNDPDASERAMNDAWYKSGDYGFRRDGQWFIVGRKKDIIIVAGRNIVPEDIEDAVGAVPGVLPGRVVAFGVDDETIGTETVCVVAETAETDGAARDALRLAIKRAAMAADVTVGRVYLAPLRWVFKSSSGKPSRSANRERVLRGELPLEET